MLKKIIAVLCCVTAFSVLAADELDDLLENGDEAIAADTQDAEENSKAFNPKEQRTLIICGSGYHLDLNPHTSSFSAEAQIINGVQEGLFSYDPKTLDPIPAIASSYKISRDKKRWTFTIRDEATFSNGQKITPQSVIDSWLLLQKTPNAAYASLMDCVEGMQEYRENNTAPETVGLKASGQKLIVTLKAPAAHLPRILCHHAFSVYTGNPEVFSGPYKIDSVTPEAIFLSKNEKYWDKENVALPAIQYRLSDNKKENTWLYNTGRADWVISSVDSDALINKNSIRISALFGTTYLFFTCRNPVWDNADFRNALITAIPWEQLRKDNLIQATSLVYPLSGYPKVEGLSETSEDEALELMQEARKKAGIPQDKQLEISFGIAKNDYMMGLAEILKNAWAPLGVTLYPMQIDENDYFANIPFLKMDIFSYSWIGDFADPTAFLELFRQGSTLNQTEWKNNDYNSLLEKAAATTDAAERYKILSQAEQVLLDDGIVMPVAHSISLHAVNPQQLGGWYTNALDIHPFKNLFLKDYEPEQAPNIVKR